MKRLEIRVPADHPIWSVPPGARSAVAREWLGIGARLAAIEERLAGVEGRLAQTEGAIAGKRDGPGEKRFLKNLADTFGIDV